MLPSDIGFTLKSPDSPSNISVDQTVRRLLASLPKANDIIMCKTFEHVIRWHGGTYFLQSLGFSRFFSYPSFPSSPASSVLIVVDSLLDSSLPSITSKIKHAKLISLTPEFILLSDNPSLTFSYFKTKFSLSFISFLPLVFCSPFSKVICLPRTANDTCHYSLSLIKKSNSLMAINYAVDLISALISLGFSKNQLNLSTLIAISTFSEDFVRLFLKFVDEFSVDQSNSPSNFSVNILSLERSLDLARPFINSTSFQTVSKLYESNVSYSSDCYVATRHRFLNPFFSSKDQSNFPLFSSIVSDLQAPTIALLADSDCSSKVLEDHVMSKLSFDCTDVNQLLNSSVDADVSPSQFALLRLLFALSQPFDDYHSLIFEILTPNFTVKSQGSPFNLVRKFISDHREVLLFNQSVVLIIYKILCLIFSVMIPVDVDTARFGLMEFSSFLIDFIIDWVKSSDQNLNFYGLNQDSKAILEYLIQIKSSKNSSDELNNVIKQSKMILSDDVVYILNLLAIIPSQRLGLPFAGVSSCGMFHQLITGFINNNLNCFNKHSSTKVGVGLKNLARSFLGSKKSRDLGHKQVSEIKSVAIIGPLTINEALEFSNLLTSGTSFLFCSEIVNSKKLLQDICT
ncbi:hypothetical protein RCL1_001844 [Eukaryota sp. TZLM3-RCL]